MTIRTSRFAGVRAATARAVLVVGGSAARAGDDRGPFHAAADSTRAVTGGTGKGREARGQMRPHALDAKASACGFTFLVEH